MNCAGILISGSVETMSVADYDQIMNINSRTAFILSQLVSPHLVASKGNMVHVSIFQARLLVLTEDGGLCVQDKM